jgi:hypothetical protein
MTNFRRSESSRAPSKYMMDASKRLRSALMLYYDGTTFVVITVLTSPGAQVNISP